MAIMKTIKIFFLIYFSLLLLSSCASKKEEVTTIETPKVSDTTVALGKRESFKERILNIKEEQRNIAETMGQTRAQLLALYSNGKNNYDHLSDEIEENYETLKAQEAVSKEHIQYLDQTARSTFKKWENDLRLIQDEPTRITAETQLQTSRAEYRTLQENLKEVQSQMSPILSELGGQVKVLKDRSNKRSVNVFKDDGAKIQNDMNEMIDNTSESINDADRLIKTL